MNISDVKEWMIIADDDFDSANILNESLNGRIDIFNIKNLNKKIIQNPICIDNGNQIRKINRSKI
jgi:hypothetical protein